MKQRALIVYLSFWLSCYSACADSQPVATPTLYRGVAVASLPMERRNFTQGLYIANSELFVSSGQYGESAVRVYQWPSMTLARAVDLPQSVFAEGLTLQGGRLFVLTWRENQLLILDPVTLATRSVGHIGSEGWGVTHNGNHLWLSNGSDHLYRIDLLGGAVTPLKVVRNGRPVTRLNELEWIKGKIWANVWMTDIIVVIDPDTGFVESEIDLDGLLPEADRRADTDVLNGIALDPETGGVWVTGKRWPKLFRIELQQRD